VSDLQPVVLNIYKKAGISSYDVLRGIKKALQLKRKDKIGHFGTLDPFAEGVLMVGLGRAAKLNNYVHDCLPKAYFAHGILGIETPSGDNTSEVSNRDDSPYLLQKIAKFEKSFIEKNLKEKFLGDYWQKPHKFSAAKFEGKKLYEYAREGVEVQKDPVLRHIYELEVVSFDFPKLSIRFKVSSGTYIRSLFSDCAQYLGTLGSLEGLVRESVGEVCSTDSLQEINFTREDYESFGTNLFKILPFEKIELSEDDLFKIKNGVRISSCLPSGLYWGADQSLKAQCLLVSKEGELGPSINFFSNS
jgi:tRNA pseudouridine55 synthase